MGPSLKSEDDECFSFKRSPQIKTASFIFHQIMTAILYCDGQLLGVFFSLFFFLNEPLQHGCCPLPPTRKINLVAVSRLHLPQMTGLFFRLIAIFTAFFFFYFSNAEKCSLISDGLISLCNSSFIQSSRQSSRTVAPMTVCLTGSPPQSPLCKPRAAPHTPSVLNHVTG